MKKENSFKIDRKITNGNMSNKKVEEIVEYSSILSQRIKKHEARNVKCSLK